MFCYTIEYFAANYFLHNGYQISNALGSAAPVGDMMIIVGTWLFGSPAAGKAFMLVQALTVFLALIGTTLSCMSTGARVTYAMGRDKEVPEHFGMLHGEKLTPHRAIWTLAGISAVVAIFSILFNFAGPAALADDVIKGLPHNVWYSFGIFSHDLAAKIPQSLLVVTLISNFGTFLLYMMTCIVAMLAFQEHHMFNGFKHVVVPIFGLLANLACMLFYLVGPFSVPGMSAKEPFVALGGVALWGFMGSFTSCDRRRRRAGPSSVRRPFADLGKPRAWCGIIARTRPMSRTTSLVVLFIAALLEAGGDAVVRSALHTSAAATRLALFALGAIVLFSYGYMVNKPAWDFGRLLGIYVVFFFVVAQAISWLVFNQRPTTPIVVGGAFIVTGGIVMSLF